MNALKKAAAAFARAGKLKKAIILAALLALGVPAMQAVPVAEVLAAVTLEAGG